MNMTLPQGRCVHWMRDGFPACGGGRHGKRGFWQLNLGEVTCQRCVKIEQKARQKAREMAAGSVASGQSQETKS